MLISDRYWRSRLGANPNTLGRAVRIGATSYGIVGIMPASFRFPDRDVDLWMPSAAVPSTDVHCWLTNQRPRETT